MRSLRTRRSVTVAIRNLMVTYNGTAGYPSGATAPLQVGIYNKTTSEVTVLISSQQPDPAVGNDVVYGTNVVLTGSQTTAPSTALPEPSGSRPAAVPETS